MPHAPKSMWHLAITVALAASVGCGAPIAEDVDGQPTEDVGAGMTDWTDQGGGATISNPANGSTSSSGTQGTGNTGTEVTPEEGYPEGACADREYECGDWADDDCDGKTDCEDADCAGSPRCMGCTPGGEVCDSGADEDCDGQVDCEDTDCAQVPECRTCVPMVERCGNGTDDDCDGSIDEDCETRTCEETEGGNCNTDPGYGDHCAPEDNNRCSEDKFWAWCNRRNPAYPDIWDTWIKNWVEQRCGGQAELVDADGADTWRCVGADNVTYACTTPLVLVFDRGVAVRYARDDGMSHFDLSSAQDGSATRTDWPTAVTPWLALDRDGDGRITSGEELFGSATRVGHGRARHGFEALATLDDNRDGRVDAKDRAFARLLVWRDGNADRASSPAELTSVVANGLEWIALSFRADARCDTRGNCEVERASFGFRDGRGVLRQGDVVDVHLRVQAARPALLACVAP